MSTDPAAFTTSPATGRARVVIIGGGFGGVAAARALASAPVDVTLVDRTNHYLFQPLLYQVATGVLSPADITVALRFLFRRQKNVTVLMSEVAAIDVAARRVVGDGGKLQLPYDFLVVAPGSRHAYFGHPEWEADAPGLKTLADARHIRDRFLRALEEAEKTDDPAVRSALLTFVIVGGGPTGVELAGILPTLTRHGFRPDFRRFDSAQVRVILVEAGRRLLPAFPEELSARSRSDLEELGVECRIGAPVTSVTRDGVVIGGEHIPARTVFWAAGNAASPLIAALGTPLDRAGRALVAPDLSTPNDPRVFVVGDAAASQMEQPVSGAAANASPQYVPGLAAAAIQMGTHAGRMIAATIAGSPRTPFHYRNKGTLAVIGRGRAIADFGRVRLTGWLAFYAWFFLHLMFLAGFRNRVAVFLEWVYAYATYRPGARLINDDDREVFRGRDETSSTHGK